VADDSNSPESMGLWKRHFHWTVLMRWEVLGWLLVAFPTAAGILLVFDQYTGADVCFMLTALFFFAKIVHSAVLAQEDPTWHRLVFTFLLFGLVGVGIVETVRGVNLWRDRHPDTSVATKPIVLSPGDHAQDKPKDDLGRARREKNSEPNKNPKPPHEKQELISSITVDLRLSCALRDPSKLPVDLVLHVPGDPTFFAGPIGRVFLEASDGVRYRRLDEEGMAYVTQFYQLPTNSFLMGQPTRTLLEYDKLTFSMDGADGKDFGECRGFEMILRLNGKETFRHAEPISFMLPATGGTFGATIRLVGIKIPN